MKPVLSLVFAVLVASAADAFAAPTPKGPIPVILATDIGDDIDDTWALALLLRSPELDLRLVLTDYGDTVYRARLTAKLLHLAGRSDVPIGIGIRQAQAGGRQAAWLGDYALAAYRGRVFDDGVQALVDMAMAAEEPITLIAIGPAPTVRAALEHEPRIAGKLRLAGMYGSLREGYAPGSKPEPEWNVRADAVAARALLGAPWASAVVTPLDTCGRVRLDGQRYARLAASKDPLLQALFENYRLWCPLADWCDKERVAEQSTTLFDTVAVYLAFARDFVKTESLGVEVRDDGMTAPQASARPLTWATEWKDLDAFRDLLVDRLLKEPNASHASAAGAGALAVAANGRHLVEDATGRPFFYLGDTAWELFHRLDRAEAERYLTDRAGKGFTVIQAVALAELDGLNTENAYGHRPLVENDPTRPDVREGEANDYWDHVDFVVRRANELGLTIALLPSWGDKWFLEKWGAGPLVFTPENAQAYGRFVGQRYREARVIWVLGGDRNPRNEEHVAVMRAMASGLAEGDGGRHLMTFHPQGGSSSAEFFHADEWLDFNMFQSGHQRRLIANHELTLAARSLAPVKPVLDGEPCYEDHPVDWKPEKGWFDEWDVRRAAYASMLSGAAGHTYGNHNVWQMWEEGREPISSARTPWQDALQHPAAAQMGYMKRLFEARPFHVLVPDQALVVGANPPGADEVIAARAEDGAFVLAYVPTGRPVTLRTTAIRSGRVRASWYNPRQHAAESAGEHAGRDDLTLTPPTSGRNNDWVLILDDATRDLAPPAPTR